MLSGSCQLSLHSSTLTRAAVALVLVVLLSATSLAGETWDGGGADSEWSTAANWNAVHGFETPPPNDGTAGIIMAGTIKLSNQLDVDWDVNSLIFNNTAGAFSINGFSGVTLAIGAGGMSNNDTQLQTLLLPIGLNASQTWTAAAGPIILASGISSHPLLPRTLTLAGGFNVTVAGPITNNMTLSKTGAGTLFLVGSDANTYAGSTSVTGGTLALSRTGGTDRAIPGNLTIGDGAGTNTVRLDAAEQITSAAGKLVTVNSSGVFNLNGFNETIRDLTINGGSVTTSGGTLTVAGSLSTTGGSVTTGGGTLAVAGSLSATGGTLQLLNNARVTSGSGSIGDPAGSNGQVTVSGAGATWNSSAELYVGNAGIGTLTVSNSGRVENNGNLCVGNSGSGTLDITDGGRVTNNSGVIGDLAGSTGLITVDGVGSRWIVESSIGGYEDVFVGSSGTGTLEITNGGDVIIGNGGLLARFEIGANVGSTGVVTVDGTGSNLSVQSDGGLILVGNVGNGTLNVTNGGNVHPDSSDFSILLDVGTLGTLNITGGGQAVDNDGSVLGTVTVDGAGSTWTNVASLSVSGTLTVTNGGMVQAPTLTVGAIGEMRGDGNIIGNVQNAGVVSPGTSPGALNIDGNYTQTASGELLIELTSASSYDQLLTTETATLSGTLTVNLLDSFLPSPGQSFTILTADDIDGMFTTETLPSVPGRIFDVIYNPNSVVLTVLSALPGDYNGNGTVDAADYTVWRDNLGGSSLPNEGASLGTVDDFDYDFWKLHFGETAGSGSAGVSPSQAAVPEPATLSLMLGGLIAALLMRGVRRTGSRR